MPSVQLSVYPVLVSVISVHPVSVFLLLKTGNKIFTFPLFSHVHVLLFTSPVSLLCFQCCLVCSTWLTAETISGVMNMDATKYPYERKYSTSNEHFRDTFPWQDFFPWHSPDNSLIVNKIHDISLTCFKFPDISRFSRQVVTLLTDPSVWIYTMLKQVLPKGIWKERIATPTSENALSHCTC